SSSVHLMWECFLSFSDSSTRLALRCSKSDISHSFIISSFFGSFSNAHNSPLLSLANQFAHSGMLIPLPPFGHPTIECRQSQNHHHDFDVPIGWPLFLLQRHLLSPYPQSSKPYILSLRFLLRKILFNKFFSSLSLPGRFVDETDVN